MEGGEEYRLTPRSISSKNPAAHVKGGVIIEGIVYLLEELGEINAISFHRTGVTGYLAVTASDAMAIIPCLQFAPQLNGLIGLLGPSLMVIDTVKELKFQ